MKSDVGQLDIETVFHAHYERIARVIARVLRDPSRAEELAVEVFLKWSRNPQAQGENAQAWLYRVAVRASLDELRRETRRMRREAYCGSLDTRQPLRISGPQGRTKSEFEWC